MSASQIHKVLRNWGIILSAAFILLFVSGCQFQDITPDWWKTLPGGFLGWKEPLSRVLVLLLPFAVMMSIQACTEEKDDSVPLSFVFLFVLLVSYVVVFFLALVGLLLLYIFTYGILGTVYTTAYLFACFCTSCIVLIVGVGWFLVLVAGQTARSTLIKSLGLVGLIIEGFGIFFTLRDMYGLFVR